VKNSEIKDAIDLAILGVLAGLSCVSIIFAAQQLSAERLAMDVVARNCAATQ
jgi:hypothetical protein